MEIFADVFAHRKAREETPLGYQTIILEKKDHIARLTLNRPERLNASYVDENGEKRRPVMLHRAILGSFERFIGVLIEHFAGRFPLWLAPVQAAVATITSDADDHALEVFERLRAAGLRAELDRRNEKIGFKVREHSVAKTPVLLVVGRREAEQGTVTLRRLGSTRQETLAVGDAILTLSEEAAAPGRGR